MIKRELLIGSSVVIGFGISKIIVDAITKKRRDKIDADINKSINEANELTKKMIDEAFPTPNFKTES